MPLDAEHKTVVAQVLDRFNQSVRRPGRGLQFPSQRFDSLMMMAIYGRLFDWQRLSHNALSQYPDLVRRPIARWALFMLDRVGPLTFNILNQRTPTRDIQHLDTKANRKQGHAPSFDLIEH